MEPVNGKPSAPELVGSVTLRILSVASFLFVNVQTTWSPGFTTTVTVLPLPATAPAPWQSMLVSDQPVVVPSVTDFEPKFAAAPEKVNVRESGVALAGFVSRLKFAGTPVEPEVNGKLSAPELTGSVTFTICNVASARLVIVQKNACPASAGKFTSNEQPTALTCS